MNPAVARVDTTVASEQERLAFAQAIGITNTACTECSGQYPMYLALDRSQQGGSLGHGEGSVYAVVNQWMSYKYPNMNWMYYRNVPECNVGDMRGRALIVSKSGACATESQWTDEGMGGARATGEGCDGSNAEVCVAEKPGALCSRAADLTVSARDILQLQLRSENQIQQDGYSCMEVFVAHHEVWYIADSTTRG